MKNFKTILAVTTALAAVAFENKGGWKKAADGTLETDSDGNPVYVDDGGKETTIAPGYINRINGEAANHRKRANDAEKKLEAFGDLDPAAAREAIEKMQDVNLDDLVNKGEIEKVRTAMREQFEKDIKDRDTALADTKRENDNLRLNNAFSASQFLNERIAVPRDMVETAYRDRFKVENGKVTPVKTDGEPVYNKHGEIASVDEALEIFISERPDKDKLLKAFDASGSGSQGGGGGRGGSNVMKRADYDALDQMQQAAVGQKMAKGEVTLVD